MSLFGELKRRNMFRVGIAYVVTSWILIQVADTPISMLGLPDWASKLALIFLLIGFLPALISVTPRRNAEKPIPEIAAEAALPAQLKNVITATRELGL